MKLITSKVDMVDYHLPQVSEHIQAITEYLQEMLSTIAGHRDSCQDPEDKANYSELYAGIEEQLDIVHELSNQVNKEIPAKLTLHLNNFKGADFRYRKEKGGDNATRV